MSADSNQNKVQHELNLTEEDTSSINKELNEILKKSQEEKELLAKKIANLENAQDIIFEQFRELEIQRLSIDKQQKKLEEASEKFRGRTIDLFGKLVDLKKAKKTISLQNDKLGKQQKEIEEHQELLEKSSAKFRERTIELFGKMIDLKKAKKTISIQKEELEVHREKLKDLNASKDRFFSIIAHDLRNPIAGFLNLTEVLSNNFEIFSEDESKEFIDVMNQASKQLYNLLENLLQWSRAQTGSISFNPKPVLVKSLFENTIDNLMVNLESKKINISIKVEKETEVFVDEDMISTVFRNLLSNAIKFSHSGETISIRCSDEGEFVKISVIDNGVGINKIDQEKLFKIDQHVTTQGTSEEKGSGLGLILCKEFIEKNNGEIWVDSEINKGSSFNFTLPKK